MTMKQFLKHLFSTENEASSKRFICILLVIVQIVVLFLLMYIKIELANKELVGDVLENMFWLTLIFGGFIAAEPALAKWKLGGPKNIVQQDVKEQTVITEKKENE